MKNTDERIKEILSKAEQELRQAIVEAAEAGEYRSVDVARAAAVGINELQTRITNPAALSKVSSGKKVARRKTANRVKKKSKRKGTGYPKYGVKKDALVRVGWSKKQRKEYTHKTPKDVFDKIVKVMSDLAKGSSGPFMAEEIIERVNHEASEIVPSYQVYVVIGFLREKGCIEQVGREGYHVPTDVKERVRKAWIELGGDKKSS